MKNTSSMKRWTTTQFHTNRVKKRDKIKKKMNTMTYCFLVKPDSAFIPKMEKDKCIRSQELR